MSISISSVLSDFDYTSLTATTSAAAVQGISNNSGGSAAVTGTGSTQTTGDSASISGPGQLFAELKQLQAQDPAKLKQVLADIASKLQTAAQQLDSSSSTQASGRASFLSSLADKFSQAASTGDVSQLQPSGGGGHHGHGHHGHHVQTTYTSSGQAAQSTLQPGTDGQDPLQALFAEINTEVTQALNTSTASAV